MKKLLHYNGFGIVSITRDKITASVTVVTDDTSITRTVVEETKTPLEGVGAKETVVLTLGVWIESGKKSRVTAHEFGRLKSGASAYEIQEVQDAVNKVLDMVKKGATIT